MVKDKSKNTYSDGYSFFSLAEKALAKNYVTEGRVIASHVRNAAKPNPKAEFSYG